MIFRNALVIGSDDHSSPMSPMEIGIECRVERLHGTDLNMMSTSINTKVSHGNFSFTLNMYNDGTYTTPYQAEDFPIHLKVGDRVFLAGSVDTVNGLDVFAKNCYATPSDSADDLIRYHLIDDG